MPQALLKHQAGLITSPNAFDIATTGGLLIADNCVVRDQGILEPRRGWSLHSTLANISRLTSYQGTFIALAGTSLEKYSAGWSAFSGSYSQPDSQNKTRFLQAVNCLFFTSSVGIFKLDSLTGTPAPAGLMQPRAPHDTFSQTSASGTWFPNNSNVAYRVLLYKKDAQGNTVKSAPSYRVAFQNTTGSAKAMNLYILTPFWLMDTSMVLQIYRSEVTASTSVVPSDDMFLIGEHAITANDIATGHFTYLDVIDQVARGAALYTNSGQEGVAQENTQPPIARDFCNFKGITIYANTTDKNRLGLTLNAIGGNVLGSTSEASNLGLLLGDTVTITSVAGSDVYTAGLGENTSTKTFLCDITRVGSGATGTQEETIRSLARVITDSVTLTNVRADCISAATQPLGPSPATIVIEDLNPGQVGWTVSIGATTYNITAGNISRTGSTVTVTQTGHPYVVGAVVDLQAGTPDAAFPVGQKTVVFTLDANHWSYTEAGSATTSAHAYTAQHFQPWAAWGPSSASPIAASPSREPAGLSYSKFNQPEAVPLENSDTVDSAADPVLRVIPLRDSVLIFKTSGVWRLTGNDPSNFDIQPYDLTTKLIWPESVDAMEDTAFFMSQKGLVAMSESGGAQLVSQAIDGTLQALRAINADVSTRPFGIAYQSERTYMLWVPSVGGSPPDQAFWFNAKTGVWTRCTTTAAQGIVDPISGALYMVDSTSVFNERKSFSSSDYQDIGGSASITAVTDSTHITMAGPGVGDLISQGLNSARVLSVGAANALTLDTAGTWSVASADYSRAIPSKLTYLPWAGGEENPGAMHKFTELGFNFRTFTGSWVNVTTATDMDPTEEKFVVYGRPSKPGNVNIRSGFSRNKGSGVMLLAGLEIAQALAGWQLQSTSLVYKPIGTRTPRQKAGS